MSATCAMRATTANESGVYPIIDKERTVLAVAPAKISHTVDELVGIRNRYGVASPISGNLTAFRYKGMMGRGELWSRSVWDMVAK